MCVLCRVAGVGAGRFGAVISSETQAATQSMMQCVCSVLAHMLADPVYKVYVAALVRDVMLCRCAC